MIDPSKWWGRATLVFFWGGLSASFVTMLWTFHPFNPLYMPWLYVFTNMIAVTVKNILLPVNK